MPKNLRKTILFLLSALLMAGLVSVSLADKQKPASDTVPLASGCINDRCAIRLDNENIHQRRLTNGVRTSSVHVRKGCGFTAEIPEGMLHSGVLYLEWTSAPDFSLCYYDVFGAQIGQAENPHLMLEQAYPLPDACARIRLTAKSGGQLSGLYVYASGSDAPEPVRQWDDPSGKADLLFVVAHSDDEVVMMGGILPVYAGERGYKVQLAYMSTNEPVRRFEALAGLKANHCTRYPRFLGVFDGDAHADAKTVLVRLIRETQPEVIVTHDLEGEYKKSTHIRTAKAVIEAYTLAADASFDPESAAEYGVWQAKKLYLHLWPGNEISLDFDMPLASFGGKTAFEVAAESFSCYRSQRIEWLNTLLENTYDCRKYGLYASTVGPDAERNDLFEHIEPGA